MRGAAGLPFEPLRTANGPSRRDGCYALYDGGKKHLKRRAAADKVSVSELLRAALGQIKAPRRRATPQADPQLVTALSRTGTNLNQIARAVNSAQSAGDMRQLDALQLLTELIGIERRMSALLASHRQQDADHAD